jgi:hypothetical protein
MATRYVAAIHLNGGVEHRHISQVVWMNSTTHKGGINSVSDMVTFVDGGGNLKVSDGSTEVSVGVVRPERGQPYLRTFRDKKWTDNLLAVSKY